MPQIQVLDEQTIDKIAAGEVVERPSSVVKELAENAIDAGSTAVTVEIRDGGTALIRITDNGCGIEKEQIPVAFYRHSTSKIRSVEDLTGISSLGFRGEALSSIAAVSQVEVITKTPDSFTGIRYLIEGGKEILLEEIGAPNGTTFLVKNIFYNTPARRKFLKTPQTEAGYINDMMERIALSHPDISFKFINNGQIRLHTSGNGKLKDTIYHIYGRDIASHLLKVQAEFEEFSVSGYIGKPVICRGNRNFESYFINGRYIKSSLIAKAIEDGYRGFLMQHKYPFGVLSIRLNGELVDVNVHPNKMELRFSDGEQLYSRIADLIHTTLQREELIDDVAVKADRRPPKKRSYDRGEIPEPFEKNRLGKLREAVMHDSPYEPKYERTAGQTIPARDAETRRKPDTGRDSISGLRREPDRGQDFADGPRREPDREQGFSDDMKREPGSRNQLRESVVFGEKLWKQIPENAKQTSLSDYINEDTRLLSAEARPQHRIIGQLFGTYWLVEYEERFYMIDQHAAHEKILFEQMMKNYREKEFTSQMISPPILLSLTMQEENLLKKYRADFEKLGFVIDSFGGKEYTVSALPGNLYGLDGQSLLLELIDGLGGVSGKDTPDMVVEKIASMSCKAAVKGSHTLSPAEAEQMIGDLLKLENPYFCPHGRPVIISMTKHEIEKKFKRIV
ncbi:MAG: DNA mismatch repair endonuclease MutL [Lachnospiraceae bacterium]|nr:DNA mismatch repair endonuclease MutL [Lachnospiraceae bacterium]